MSNTVARRPENPSRDASIRKSLYRRIGRKKYPSQSGCALLPSPFHGSSTWLGLFRSDGFLPV